MTFTGPKVGSVTRNVNMVVAVKDHGVSLQPIAAGAADEAERSSSVEPAGPFQDEEQCSLTSREGAGWTSPLSLLFGALLAQEGRF